MAFGGIFLAINQFKPIMKEIDAHLGLRCRLSGYQYGEIVQAMMCNFLCGGDRTEDINRIKHCKYIFIRAEMSPALKQFLDEPQAWQMKDFSVCTKTRMKAFIARFIDIFTDTYTLLQIDTSKLLPNTKFSFDPIGEGGVYTLDNIPPKAINIA